MSENTSKQPEQKKSDLYRIEHYGIEGAGGGS